MKEGYIYSLEYGYRRVKIQFIDDEVVILRDYFNNPSYPLRYNVRYKFNEDTVWELFLDNSNSKCFPSYCVLCKDIYELFDYLLNEIKTNNILFENKG